VASSSTRTLDRWRIARAMQSSWSWPAEKFSPPSRTSKSVIQKIGRFTLRIIRRSDCYRVKYIFSIMLSLYYKRAVTYWVLRDAKLQCPWFERVPRRSKSLGRCAAKADPSSFCGQRELSQRIIFWMNMASLADECNYVKHRRYFVRFAYLIVPLNIIASCGIADNRDRSIRRGTCRMSIPSKSTRPWLISISRKRAITLDDFPLPVLPQMPNYECQLCKRISFVSFRIKIKNVAEWSLIAALFYVYIDIASINMLIVTFCPAGIFTDKSVITGLLSAL
jgi:hypothetical protein